MPKPRRVTDSVSLRIASAKRNAQKQPIVRWLGARGVVTVVLGGVLSVGGLSEAMHDVHFLVEKDLDSVRVVKEQDGDSTVVAKIHDGFAANSLFKLSGALPDRYVSRELALFGNEWLPKQEAEATAHRGVFREEMRRISEVIHREFFAEAVPYGELIHEKAVKYDVDPALVAAVVETESRFRKGARSQVGAQGLMQLMPRTGRWMGARNLYDPEQNVDAGVKYIKYLSERFHGDLKKTIAAYNAGEGNVKRYNGVPPFGETQQYVRKVLRSYRKRNEQLKEYNEQRTGGGPVVEDGALTLR